MQKEEAQKIIHSSIMQAWSTLKPLAGNEDDAVWESVMEAINRIANGMPDDCHICAEEVEPLLSFVRAPRYGWMLKSDPVRNLPFKDQVEAATAVYMLRIAEAIGGVKEWE